MVRGQQLNLPRCLLIHSAVIGAGGGGAKKWWYEVNN